MYMYSVIVLFHCEKVFNIRKCTECIEKHQNESSRFNQHIYIRLGKDVLLMKNNKQFTECGI